MNTSWNALAEIGQILAADRKRPQSHENIIEVIRDATQCSAIALAQYNPISGQHQTLCNIGYASPTLDHLNNWFVTHDEVYRYMRTYDSRPLRWKDMPFAYEAMYSATKVFKPAGFQEGVSVCLYNTMGSYTGSLHISSVQRDFATDDAMRLLEATQRIVGSAADWWQGLGDLEHKGLRVVLTDANSYKVLLSQDDDLHRLFDTCFHRAGRIDLKTVPVRSFLVSGTRSASVSAHYLENAVILNIQRQAVHYALTARELDVASILIQGKTNDEIAYYLGIANKTAAHHVSNVIQKLACRTRTEAAITAERLGLRSFAILARNI